MHRRLVWEKIFMNKARGQQKLLMLHLRRLKEEMEIDIRTLRFDENDKLDQTAYTQAALVTTCLAMQGPWKKRVFVQM